jgi:hypothetical protein
MLKKLVVLGMSIVMTAAFVGCEKAPAKTDKKDEKKVEEPKKTDAPVTAPKEAAPATK